MDSHYRRVIYRIIVSRPWIIRLTCLPV